VIRVVDDEDVAQGNGGGFEVKFRGWDDDFNRVVPPSDRPIRLRIDPFRASVGKYIGHSDKSFVNCNVSRII
jgi:hypothetical protein